MAKKIFSLMLENLFKNEVFKLKCSSLPTLFFFLIVLSLQSAMIFLKLYHLKSLRNNFRNAYFKVLHNVIISILFQIMTHGYSF